VKILFITPRLPYPPYKGDKLRAYQQIKYLSKNHSLTLVSFIESKDELRYVEKLKKYCGNVKVVLLKRYISYLKVFLFIFSKIPFQVAYYYSGKMKEEIKKTLKNGKFDVIHTELIRMAPYVFNFHKIPKVYLLI